MLAETFYNETNLTSNLIFKMPLDYTQPPSAYITYTEASDEYYEYQNQISPAEMPPANPTPPANNTPNLLSGQASIQSEPIFNPQAVWGPVKARLIPDTKRTLARVFSNNISNLSETEYNQLRSLIEYIATNPQSKARVFELTGFNDSDLEMAEKYFSKYKGRKFFAKLVNIALSTSSNGKVSQQIGGLLQFIFETGQVNGLAVGDEYKYKLMAGIPSLSNDIWTKVSSDCQSGGELCTDKYKEFLDLKADGKIDNQDVEAATSSLKWLQEQGAY